MYARTLCGAWWSGWLVPGPLGFFEYALVGGAGVPARAFIVATRPLILIISLWTAAGPYPLL